MKSFRIDTDHSLVATSRADAELAHRVRLYLGAQRKELVHLSVVAELGNVRLVGAVDSFYLKQLALSRARRVAGVVCVIDELEVRSEPEQRGDALLLAARLPR
jgi:osmotically-inducible protein OsmY